MGASFGLLMSQIGLVCFVIIVGVVMVVGGIINIFSENKSLALIMIGAALVVCAAGYGLTYVIPMTS